LNASSTFWASIARDSRYSFNSCLRLFARCSSSALSARRSNAGGEEGAVEGFFAFFDCFDELWEEKEELAFIADIVVEKEVLVEADARAIEI